jgi:hypothetical protein
VLALNGLSTGLSMTQQTVNKFRNVKTCTRNSFLNRQFELLVFACRDDGK